MKLSYIDVDILKIYFQYYSKKLNIIKINVF